MPELLLVADDLTGATDTGVQFARYGISVRVTLDAAEPMSPEDDDAVLVVDTESRHLDAREAARRVHEVVARARHAGTRRFFKKTDSTLRGNVGSELDALRQAAGCRLLAFVPALPSLGRTTRGGVQHVHGQPLHRTDFARDPLEPVLDGSVPDLLRRQTEAPVLSIGLDGMEDPTLTLPDSGILVMDAETDQDLRRIVGWLDRRDLLRAVAGTAALARALAESVSWKSPPRPLSEPPCPAPGPILVVGGSLNGVSLAQLDRATGAGFATVHVPPRLLVEAEGEDAPALDRVVGEVALHLASGRDVLLRSARSRADADACTEHGERLGLSPAALHLRVAGSMGRIVRGALSRERVGMLMVMGGDTLAGVIRALGCPALMPRWEALPGVPVSELSGAGGLLVASKAGGFGPEDVVMRVMEAIARGRSA